MNSLHSKQLQMEEHSDDIFGIDIMMMLILALKIFCLMTVDGR